MAVQTFERLAFFGESTGSGIALINTDEKYVHRAGTDNSITYEVWIYAINALTIDQTVTIYWATTGSESGGVFTYSGERGSSIVVNIPAQEGPVLVIPGFMLQGNGTELWISATTSATTAGLSIYGYINKITTETVGP